MRRPHGQQLNNSNLRGGASRRQREDPNSKHKTMGLAVRNKFDSIAQAYNSNGQNKDDYAAASNSQQNFAGLTSMIVAAG